MQVGLDLVLSASEPFALHRLAARSSDPADRWHGRFLAPEALARRHALSADDRAALEAWARARGLCVLEPGQPSPWRLRLRADASRLRAAFGAEAVAAIVERDPSVRGIPLAALLPPALRGMVSRIDVVPDPVERWRRRWCIRGGSGLVPPPPRDPRPVTPSAFREALEVPHGLHGRGEHVAVMAIGGEPRAEDLRAFAHAFGGAATPIHVVELGRISEPVRHHPMHRHETTMLVQWLAAVVPAARITIVMLDAAWTADPWAAFYEAVLAETSPPVTVAVTSWSSPERQHYRVHGRETSALRLSQLAAIGCTVVAATGDWGVVEGFPATPYENRSVCRMPWPGVSYPACEPGVLAVGGTVGFGAHAACLRSRLSDALAEALPVSEIASSGGFSEAVPIPAWQAPHLRPAHPRSGDAPAVVPGGRGVPDVALPAWGTPACDSASAEHAYWGIIDGRWRSDIGGTSLGAALWGAIVAQANQALVAEGRPRVGWVTPRLYRLRERDGSILRSIDRGTTDVTMPVVDAEGRVVPLVVPGYRAGPGWDPATGLGLPRVGALVDALVREGTAERVTARAANPA